MELGSGRMVRYALSRAAQAVPLILGVVVSSFLLIQLIPGDPVNALAGEFAVTDEYRDALYEEYGLDKSIWYQLWSYIGNVMQGDFGYSFFNRQPVLDLVLERATATAVLVIVAMLFATVVGIGLGVLGARHLNSPLDNGLQILAVSGYALPVFWLGQMLIIVFAINLGWFPTGGMRDFRNPQEGFGAFLSLLVFLVLPALTLSFRYLAINMRITRVQVVEVLRSDYVTGARAHGLPERRVVWRHAVRNALLPVVTVSGFNLGNALSGSVLVETVFNWPGLGQLLAESITARDHPVVLGIFIFSAVVVIVANLITDVIYAALDPRIKY